MASNVSAADYRTRYAEYVRRKWLAIGLLTLCVLVLAIASIAAGSSGLGVGDVLSALAGSGSRKTSAIVWNVRMPRIVTSILVGCSLALAGCVMQCVLRNPLASASTLGVSQGASFGATIAIIGFGAGVQHTNATSSGVVGITNPYLVTLFAFIGGMLTVTAILCLSRLRNLTPAAMILAGVAMSSLFMGGTTLAQYFSDDVALASVVYWTFGDLGRAGTTERGILGAALAVSFIYFLANSWSYNALGGGTHTARSLGVNVGGLTLAGMTLSAFLSATAVSFVGIINFVGLIAPHMIRKFVGEDYRFLLPASALTGACVLLASDLAGRLAMPPTVLPIGAITSFLGAPLFLYLIYTGRGVRS